MDERLYNEMLLRPGVENISALLLSDMIKDVQIDLRELINYTDDMELPEKAVPILKEMILLKINRLGYEGISSTSVSGTSETYINGYPADLMVKIKKLRRMKL